MYIEIDLMPLMQQFQILQNTTFAYMVLFYNKVGRIPASGYCICPYQSALDFYTFPISRPYISYNAEDKLVEPRN